MPRMWDPLTDAPDLHGKVAVVTGGNAGIGLVTVKYLALRGAKVYFTARSEAKAQKARDHLKASHPDIDLNNLVWLLLDLADLKTVTSAVEELKKKEDKVDILINNAGFVTGSTETVGPGWESHMAVCHVGHFVFTNGIMPLLKHALTYENADVRVVTLSSCVVCDFLPPNYDFHFDSPSFLTNPAPSYPWRWRYLNRHIFVVDMIRYGVAKAANMMFAQELQRLMDQQGLPIISTSVHPGGVATDSVTDIGNSVFGLLVRTTFITPDQGGVTPFFAATAKEVRDSPEKYKGRFLEPFGKVGTPHVVTKNEKQVRGLWDNTTAEANKYLVELGLAPLGSW